MKISFVVAQPSKLVGMGHVSRCNALWQAFSSLGYPSTFCSLSEAMSSDIAIIDDYVISQEQLHLLSRSSVFTVLIRDFDTNLVCDMYIDTAVDSVPRYTLLRHEFLNTTPINIKPQVTDILLTLGGTDPHDLSSKAKHYIGLTMPHTTIHTPLGNCPYNEMYSLMSRCDIALSGAGGTIWELFSLGVPSLFLCQARNQAKNASFLQEHGLLLSNIGEAAPKLLELARDFNKRKRIQDFMISASNPNGAIEAAQAVLAQYKKSKSRSNIGRVHTTKCTDL